LTIHGCIRRQLLIFPGYGLLGLGYSNTRAVFVITCGGASLYKGGGQADG